MASPKRSPVLGYNHNVRYRGLVFHVQTEDSGASSPHIFTHLFHAGVILSTRKLVYDADAAEDVVKGLMQAQHKAFLKLLKAQTFDDKIDQYLGNVEGLLPRGAGDGSSVDQLAADEATIPPEIAAAGSSEMRSGALPPPVNAHTDVTATRLAPAPPRATAPQGVVQPPGANPSSTFSNMIPPPPHEHSRPAGRVSQVIVNTESAPRTVTGAFRLAAEANAVSKTGVAEPARRPIQSGPRPAINPNTIPPITPNGYSVVRGKATTLPPGAAAAGEDIPTRDTLMSVPRPTFTREAPGNTGKNSVITNQSRTIGAPSAVPPPVVAPPTAQMARAATAAPPRAATSSRMPTEQEHPSSIFGKSVISEKSLDEVILAYLSEDK